MRKSGIDRSKIFYTSKIPVNLLKNYESAKSALEASFAAAKLDYIDLYVYTDDRYQRQQLLTLSLVC